MSASAIQANSMASVVDNGLGESSSKASHGTDQGHAAAGGVSFRDVNCYGFMTSSQYQSTVATWLLAIPRLLLRSVSARQRDTQRVEILHGINGLVHSGEMLLVLGRPGSGCSTFLKTLAGDTYGFEVDDDGINYQGISYRAIQREHKGDCVYIAELDVHFPELTLGQTLAFAVNARATSSDNIHPRLRIELNRTSRDIASLFHLESAFNTRVGNSMIRGISGGEKRRTSLAEAFVSAARFQCWDNSTRGLDSSTALDFITLLRSSTDRLRPAILMSIYQASEAQYKNFDKVMLLYEGRQIYFGPTALATAYFEELGFAKSSHSPTPDFLTSITNPAERVVRDGYEHQVPRTPDEFAAIWRQSRQARVLYQEMSDFEATYPLLKIPQINTKSPSTTRMISIHEQILLCLQRGLQRLRNNYVPVVAGIVANSILALLLGSAFYSLPPTADSMDKRAVLLFFSLIINACTPAFEVLTMWAQRPIVEKHDRYAYYYPFTEGVTSMLCDLPNKLGTSIIFNLTLYFMTNLRRTVQAFFVYYLFNFVVLLTMSMYFRMVGSVSRRMEQTMAPSSIAVLLCTVYAGFVIPVPYMVPWLGWFRFINPLAYVYESLMINEFRDRSFLCLSTVPAGPAYASVSNIEGKVCPVIGAVPGESVVHGDSYLAKKYNYVSNHIWRNLPIVFALMLAFCTIHLVATQFIAAQKSKGDILIFRRHNQLALTQKTRRAMPDNESNLDASTKFAQDINKLENRDDHDSFEKGTSAITIQTVREQSKVFHWKGLNYDLKTKDATKRILSNVTGWVKPGTLTALMGVSGAGKTTLLDVLANRTNSGATSGNIFVGNNVRDFSFQRRVGYVQQDDVHPPAATVRETLELSALLRQCGPETELDKLSYVNVVLGMLDMEPYADAVVGIPGEGLNIEQRKRLSIGVELVAKPELLLFLDEPTSGLDSQTAWSICTLLRKLADNGQAVLCTIHQPSSQIFQMFDRLLLLSRRGQTLYFGEIGPHATTVINYFNRNGAPDYPVALANPAEWILDVTNGRDNPDEWSDKFSHSEQNEQVLRYQNELLSAIDDKMGNNMIRRGKSEYAAPYLRQLRLVTTQVFREYWRDPTYVYSKMALCAGLSLFNGLSFTNTPLDTQGLTNLVFSIFLLSMLFSTVDQQIIPRFIESRTLYESREGRSKSYSWFVFLSVHILIELVWQTLAAIVVFVAWYYPTGLWRNGDSVFSSIDRGALSFVLIWLFCLWISTFSQAVAVTIEHAETAVQIGTLFFWLSLVFCGVLVPPKALPGFWIFVYRVSPLTYFVKGMVLAGLGGTQLHCSPAQMFHINLPDPSLACGEYLASYVQLAGGYIENPTAASDCRYCPVSKTDTALRNILGMDTDDPWLNAGFMAAYVVFNAVAVFALYWLTRLPKRRAIIPG